MFAFGIDVGGTTIKCGLFEADGTVVEKWEIKTNKSDKGAHIIDEIAETIENKLSEKEISKDNVAGIGIGVPGAVTSDGVVHGAVNIGWKGDIELAKILTEKTGLKCHVGNDANVAALGECWMGAAQKYNSIVMVTLGTGVGGGIVVDGQIINGAFGSAGEIGHIVINELEDTMCNCGNYGCLEQYCSATGFARMTRKGLNESNMDSVLRKFKVERISAKTLFDAVKKDDELAIDIAQNACDLLGTTLARIGCVVDPDAYVIGGGVSKAGDIIVDMIRPSYEKHAFHTSKNVPIVIASLGNDAGIYGAVKLALSEG